MSPKSPCATMVLDSTPRVSVAVARSLAKRGIPVYCAFMAQRRIAPASAAITGAVPVPDVRDSNGFKDALMTAIRKLNVDLLIPCSDITLRAVSEFYEPLKAQCDPGCPPPHVLDRVLDKAQTLRIAQRCGVEIPRTLQAANLDELRIAEHGLSFPVIAKPRLAGIDTLFKTRRFETQGDLEAAFVADPAFGVVNIVQEFLDGEGLGVEMLVRRGQPVVVFAHRRLKEWPRSGGVGVLVESQAIDSDLRDQATALLAAIEWDGLAMVEFKRDRTGRPKLMEVNGRFWGSLPLATKAGVDFPYYFWQQVHDLHVRASKSYPVGFRVRWSGGDIWRLRDALFGEDARKPESKTSVARELGSFLSDFHPAIRSAMWSFFDPAPAVQDSFAALRDLAMTAGRAVLAKCIPRPVRKRIGETRWLSARPRYSYFNQWLRRTLRLHNDRLPQHAGRWRKIVFVCRGNIIRSPFAAALLQRRLTERGLALGVDSAGTHAVIGKAVDPRAQRAAAERGTQLNGHQAQPLTPEMLASADAVFVMDYVNEAEVRSRFRDANHKTYLLGASCRPGSNAVVAIDDPDRGTIDDIRTAYDSISNFVDYLADRLATR